MRKTSRNEYQVLINHATVPDAEQRVSSAFSLIFGASDLSHESASDIAAIHGRKDEKLAIEKTAKEQE